MLKLVMLKRCIVSRKFMLSDIKRYTTKSDCCYKLATSDSDSTKHDGISSSLVKRVVKGAGFPVTEGFTTIQTVCPVCSENDKRSKNIVYINKITGLFSCPTCQHSASWENISKFFELKSKDVCSNHLIKEREIFIQSKARKSKYVPEYTKKKLNLLRNDIHLLNNTWISAFINPTLKLPVSFNTENGDVHFPLCNSQNIVVGEKICNVFHIETETTLPNEGCYGLLTLKLSSKESSKAVIVLTVKDFLTLAMQKLESTSVICLPYGLKLLPQECLPCLETFKELILWFDFDDAGWDSALNFARKLDEKRCLFIRPTNEQQTPYTAFKSGLNIKAIIQDARPILHKSITTFACLKQDIFSELQNIEKVNGVKWTRYPSLNKILKGHRKGELTILTGPTGCGKTTFMSEYSLDLAIQGVTTLWGSFEIRNIRLASTLLRQFVGYPLNDKLEEFDYWTSKIEKLPIYFTTFHGQQSLKIVMDAIDHAQYIHDIHHIIIDNVQFMLGMGTGSKFNDKFWEQDNIISAFRTFATKKNVHVTLVMHPRKEKESEDLTTNSIFGSAKAAQEADNVLIIQDKRLTSIRGKKVLQVVKNRYSGDLGIMPLDFDKEALSYAQRKKK